MNWLRELGPTTVASVCLAFAAFGIAHNWPHHTNQYLLWFAGFLLIASLTERACSALANRWKSLVGPSPPS